MKNHLIIFAILLVNAIRVFAQWGYIPPIPTIDNKGNRTQTYPNVTTINSAVQELIDQVSIDNLENDIRFMQNFGRRDAQSPAALETQNWLYDKFESIGLDVSIQHFTSSMYPAYGDTIDAGNVVAVKYGTDFPDQYIIISSHYDQSDGPGADDNASGTAGVVECARILSQIETKRSIIFVPFNAEEYWMHGSVPFAIKCAQENMNILGVFNLDMLGFYPAGFDTIKMFTGHSIMEQKLFEYHLQVANLYVPDVPTLTKSNGPTTSSDHASFIWNDYPALYIGDIEFIGMNYCYHKLCDTIGEFGGVNNLSLAEAFVKATIASVAELANGWLPPQNFSAVSGVDKVTLSWDAMPETSKYKVYKNDMLLTETSSDSYIDNNVVLGETYAYFVTGIHSDTHEESNPSNIDEMVYSKPLTIPYSLDVTGDKEELKYWYYKDWRVGTYQNTGPKYLYAAKSELSVMELDWFSIPEDTPNLSLRIIAKSTAASGTMKSQHAFIEATSDRKTWHKLAKNVDFKVARPDTLFLSLNEFIGSPFFQLRIRIGSHGISFDVDRIWLFGIDIAHTHVSIAENKIAYFKNLQLYPNPSTGLVTIKTESENQYALSVYDLNGKRILQRNDFQDGTLDLSSLSKGAYFIQVSQDNHQVAKKIVLH
jgi:hypothetical protein